LFTLKPNTTEPATCNGITVGLVHMQTVLSM